MSIPLPELERLPPEQRRIVLDEAVRTVNATHGRLGPVPHYVGCALATLVVVPLAILEKGLLAALVVGVPAYLASLVVGVILWRRSMAGELRRLIAKAVADRGAA